MSQIHILPVNLRNKIAAGEVVERPASVVKELLENSIDAGSTRIEVDIARAGKRLIKVSDNGIGMDRDDALLSFERYATSKIKEESDLFNIRTMGFRGEALSSIASVSKVRLITGLQDEVGTCLEITGGEIKEIKDCPARGTTIEVKDLFFNTPARRKFLKSDTTENYHIIDTVMREAISHHQRGFVLRMDGSDILNLPEASSVRERLLQIFGREFIDGLIEAESEDGGMTIKAFSGRPDNVRNNKNNQFLFINRRPVKDQSITYAVYKAYEGLIPKDKHPVFFLFLEIYPQKVDFNVHPAKREVRFEDKSRVFNFAYHAVKAELKKQKFEVRADNPEQISGQAEYPINDVNPRFNGSLMQPFTPMQIGEPQGLDYAGHTETLPYLYLGDTLVAIPEKNGLAIIDYHAAHERINYERLLKKINVTSYRLLFPQQVKLQGSEYKVILDNLQLLREMGIEVEDFGHGAVIVKCVPEFLSNTDFNALMSDVAASLINEGQGSRIKGQGSDVLEPIDSVKKMLAARLACHSSIRGKEVPDSARIAMLLKDLEAAENPNTCPHGRPTRIIITTEELRKMFRK